MEIAQNWDRMAREGVKYSEIAKQYGVTKNKVAGAIYRFRNPDADRIRHARKMKDKKPRNRKPKRSAKNGEMVGGKRMPLRPDQKVEERSGPTIDALGRFQCRYPVTHDRPYMFCGKFTMGTYCQEHSEICYVPIENEQ